ncbi:MAG: ABC transporter permease [Chloroflexi bacterium]|nr:ABC transporter permease [Chloroflexota bacterium]
MNHVIVHDADVDAGIGRLSALAYLIYAEIVKVVRVPMFLIFGLAFPTLLFALFGLPSVDQTQSGINAGRFMMASFGTYAVMGVALLSVGVSIASERGMGWYRLLRATPIRPMHLFTAKIAAAVLLGLASLLVLYLFAALVGHVRMGTASWCAMVGLLLIGMIPFIALGLWIGHTAGPTTAPAIANLIYLPLAFASGLFIPVEHLPATIRGISPFLPSYHIAQLGWTFLGAGDRVGMPTHLLWLAGYTALFLALARWAYRRDEHATFS